MSTITREQAQKIIEAANEVITALAGTNEDVHPESDSMLRLWDDLNDRYAPPEVVRELARIALASLEAEAVGFIHPFTPFTFGKSSGAIFKEETRHYYKPVYAAPPATVSMKDHQIRELVNELRDIAVEYHGTQQLRERIARTVRAAMLQGADGNSPVIQDGWIRCSEKMPEEHDAVLVCQEGGIIFCAEYESGCFYPDEFPNVPKEGREITHWMALPAAPKVSE